MFVHNEFCANCLALCGDQSRVVIAGLNVFKIYAIEERFLEIANLRQSSAKASHLDVAWSRHDDHRLATASTNGHVIIWNLDGGSRAKQELVFEDHRRTVSNFGQFFKVFVIFSYNFLFR